MQEVKIPHWFKRLWDTDDMYIKKTCGTDVALYLCFLRYCSILFFISKCQIHKDILVAVFSITVLLPLFSTSNSAGNVTSLERLTLINA